MQHRSSFTADGEVLPAAGEVGAYTLGDLQAYLQQFPAAHYSHNGREPLLYATVLLLSLQFRAAVAFLAQDASAKDYRTDAVHLAIALVHHQVRDTFPFT
jgi:nuclear pore complex protein Nup93